MGCRRALPQPAGAFPQPGPALGTGAGRRASTALCGSTGFLGPSLPARPAAPGTSLSPASQPWPRGWLWGWVGSTASCALATISLPSSPVFLPSQEVLSRTQGGEPRRMRREEGCCLEGMCKGPGAQHRAPGKGAAHCACQPHELKVLPATVYGRAEQPWCYQHWHTRVSKAVGEW